MSARVPPPQVRPRVRYVRVNAPFLCVSLTALVVGAVSLVIEALRSTFVHQELVFAHDPYLHTGDIPYWNRPGFPINQIQAQAYAFPWWVFATDFINVFVAFYVCAAMLVSLACRLDTVRVTFLSIILWIVLLIQITKSVYFTLYWFSWFTLNCVEYPFCINRDLATPADHPDSLFYWELFLTYASIIPTVVFLFLPARYREAQLSSREMFESFYSKYGNGSSKLNL